jgi:DNA gyrase/topoisomerase IV subunit A
MVTPGRNPVVSTPDAGQVAALRIRAGHGRRSDQADSRRHTRQCPSSAHPGAPDPVPALPDPRSSKQSPHSRRPRQGGPVCPPLGAADHLAVIGDNGKILIFPTAELPEMPRGKGVKLQTYREGGLRDATTFNADEGAAWIDAGGRNRQWPEWREWLGRRAGAGKLAPKGFPAGKRFRPR